MTSPDKTKTLMIGWDSADWQILRPMIDKGWMPTLKGLIDRGVHGNLSTLSPTLSPILWNSIATGKRGYDHGILGFIETNADGTDVQPSSSTSRKTRALWNILNHQGYHTNVVSWFASHPAEPINGVCVSDQYASVHIEEGARKPIPADAIHPESWRDQLADLRVDLGEISIDDVAQFIAPNAKIDAKKDNSKLQTIRKLIAEITAVHGAATMIMEHESWDFMGVYYQTLDLAKHHFMEYHPPQMGHVSDEDFGKYRDVVTNMYRLHDLMLGRLLQLAGEDTLVVLCSDHGFLNDHLRPKNSSATDPKQAASWHRHHGMLVMAGPNIAQGQEVYGAGLLDVLPTTLTAMGLPVGSDMEGRVLLPVFESPPQVEQIPSWDKVEGDFGEHPAGKRFSPLDAGEAMTQLVELGYLADAPDDAKGRVASTELDMKSNLISCLVDGQRVSEAKELLEELLVKSPEDTRFLRALAQCEDFLGNKAKAMEIISQITDEQDEELSARLLLVQEALKYNGAGDTKALVDEYLAEEDPDLHFLNQLGQTLVRCRAFHEAIRVFHVVLERNPDDAGAYDRLALAHLRVRDYDAAADLALQSIGLAYDRPRAHATLGIALARIGHIAEAFDALNIAIQLRPNWHRPYRILASLSRLIGEDELANLHKRNADQRMRLKQTQITQVKQTSPQRDTASPRHAPPQTPGSTDTASITVVSGLPRSGTSLMMQALRAGGVPPLTDERRTADEDNPQGYYELERVKQIMQDDSFLDTAQGKSVKLIHALVTHLPPRHRFRVIMMRRDLDEVLRSQAKMLERAGRDGANLAPDTLKTTYVQQMQRACEWLDLQPNVERFDVEYAALIADPIGEMARINAFMGGALNTKAMASVVDPTLYRNR